MRNFLIGLLALIAICVVSLLISNQFGYSFPSASWGVLAFVSISTFLVHLAFIFGSRQSGQTSIGLLMGTVVGHMLVNILFILPVLYFNQEAVIQLTLVFFVTLIIFMIYEITMISIHINSKTSE